MTSKEVIQAYYKVWLHSDRNLVKSFLSTDLRFRSPENSFDNADAFLDTCWGYSGGFDQMNVEHAIDGSDGGFIVYSSGDLCCWELLRLKDGKFHEIYVTFNPTR